VATYEVIIDLCPIHVVVEADNEEEAFSFAYYRVKNRGTELLKNADYQAELLEDDKELNVLYR